MWTMLHQHSSRKQRIIWSRFTTIVPIVGGGEVLGTLVLARLVSEFLDDDLNPCEYSSTVVGMEILRESRKKIEEEARK